jgi:hypothetical protein
VPALRLESRPFHPLSEVRVDGIGLRRGKSRPRGSGHEQGVEAEGQLVRYAPLSHQPSLDGTNRVRALSLGVREQNLSRVRVALDDVVVLNFRRARKAVSAFERAMCTRRLGHMGQQTSVLELVENDRDREDGAPDAAVRTLSSG